MSHNQSRQEIEEEKAQWSMKFFDYAESPIKEWIAAELEETIETIFDDYKDESDVISMEIDKEYYLCYLTHCPVETNNGSAFCLTSEELKKHENLQKATSIMFDAVYTVFPPVVKTMTNLFHRMEDVFPKFDEKTMSFSFFMVNKYQIMHDQGFMTLNKIQEQWNRLIGVSNEEADSIREKLDQLRTKTVENINLCTVEKITNQEKICKEANAKYEKSPKLYLVLEKNTKPNEESIMRRLPEFGLKYQDPDEETYIDKLKREQNINE